MVSKLVNKEIVAQLIGFLISCIWDRKLLSKIGDNGGSFVYGCLRVGGFDLLKIIDIWGCFKFSLAAKHHIRHFPG